MHRILHHTTRHVTHIVRRGHHHLKRKRNRFLLGIMIVNMILMLHIWSNMASYPHTYIGTTSVGNASRDSIASTLRIMGDRKRNFDINGRVYSYSYEDLGIYLDIDQTIAEIWKPNRLPFPVNVGYLLVSVFRRRAIDPVLYFSEDYTGFVEKTIYDFSDGSDIIYVDQSNKSIGYVEQTARFSLDPFSLQVILTEQVGNKHGTITAPVIPVDNVIKQTYEQTNSKLSRVYQNPLTLIVGGPDNHQFFTLTNNALKNSTIASVSADKTAVTFAVDIKQLEMYIAPLYATLGQRITDQATTSKLIANHVRKALTRRFDGIHADSVGILLDGGPNTDGDLAPRYIEVDISQQKLYTYRDGQLIKTYRVSTGKDYPTPTGEFTILNKTGLGFSAIYDVWMPWWMGFAYSSELGAYFGIHELPYALTEGTKIQRPRDFIGTPNTGGCVALDVGEAKEVYQFADIGTKVIIYQ